MPRLNIITTGMAGVDMKTNPLYLPEERLAAATNVSFEEGVIQTRPSLTYHSLGITGQFQGAAVYSPSRGLSHQPFSDPFTALVIAAGGSLHYCLSRDCYVDTAIPVGNSTGFAKKEVNMFQAENYLIAQSPFCDTIWWEGAGDATPSPGLSAPPEKVEELVQVKVDTKELAGANRDCCFQKIEYCEMTPVENPDAPEGSHDTFIWANHRNFLINSAGLGVYSNGRIHQQGQRHIYVSDIIHKRGHLTTEDILLMEEQMAGAFGEPLATNSRLGQLTALEVLPDMTGANGEGALIAYYTTGVVAFDTAAAPRETKVDPADGRITQEGWSERRQINHLLNRISAVGRYAVAVLPRDHAFRSRYGVHLLKTSLGQGSFNDEYINSLSQDVQPILDADSPCDLKGATVGHWTSGSRIMASTGMVSNDDISASPFARGFVVWNQATTFTEDRTPRPLWEGLWSPHYGIAGIHRFVDVTNVNGDPLFGFVCSKSSGELFFATLDGSAQDTEDCIDGESEQIEWDVTSRQVFSGFSQLSVLKEGRLEIESTKAGGSVRVMVRTDSSSTWQEWKSFDLAASESSSLHSLDLGLPPKNCREASWFQFKVEGLGRAVVRQLEAEINPDRQKMNAAISTHSLDNQADKYHKYNTQPRSKRWS